MTHALAHGHLAPPLAFYATIAGVIPVLFLALILQTTVYDDLLKDTARATERLRERYARRTGDTFTALPLLAAMVWPVTALLILAAGADGELAAISALAHNHGSTADAGIAFGSVALLIIAVIAGPAGAFGTALVRLLSVAMLGLRAPVADGEALAGEVDDAGADGRPGAPALDPGIAPGEPRPRRQAKPDAR